MILSPILPPLIGEIAAPMAPLPLLATVVAEDSPIILSGVLLTLVVIYLASKLGAVSRRGTIGLGLGDYDGTARIESIGPGCRRANL